MGDVAYCVECVDEKGVDPDKEGPAMAKQLAFLNGIFSKENPALAKQGQKEVAN